jgi:hypothetical protein
MSAVAAAAVLRLRSGWLPALSCRSTALPPWLVVGIKSLSSPANI